MTVFSTQKYCYIWELCFFNRTFSESCQNGFDLCPFWKNMATLDSLRHKCEVLSKRMCEIRDEVWIKLFPTWPLTADHWNQVKEDVCLHSSQEFSWMCSLATGTNMKIIYIYLHISAFQFIISILSCFEGVLSCCFGLITDRENVGGLRWVLGAVMLQETTDDGWCYSELKWKQLLFEPL